MEGSIILLIMFSTGAGFFAISRLVERGAIKLAKKLRYKSFIKSTNTINFENNQDFQNDSGATAPILFDKLSDRLMFQEN